MSKGILGKKIGMTSLYNEAGAPVPVTVIQAGPCPVLLKRETERDGYKALQLGFDPLPNKRVNKPQAGHFKKAAEKLNDDARTRILSALVVGHAPEKRAAVIEKIRPHYTGAGMRFVRELAFENTDSFEVGQIVDVSIFATGDRVDIIGTSKGRGFAGPYKRHGSKPGPASHGSMYHRRPGSNGGSSDPSRTYKRKPGAGRYGGTGTTALNLKVVKADPEKNLLYIHGAVPGANNGYVLIRTTVKTKRRKAEAR